MSSMRSENASCMIRLTKKNTRPPVAATVMRFTKTEIMNDTELIADIANAE